MKKIIPVIVVSILVTGTLLLWFSGSASPMPYGEIVQFVVIFLIAAFALYFAWARLRSVKRGEPPEDELSKMILQKASSKSYYVSLYLWVAMIFVNDRTSLDTEVLLGTGVLGMAVIWVLLVIWFRFKGLKDA